MSETQRESRIVELLGKALELEGPERQSFLDDECGEDAELRREVVSMLVEQDGLGDFLEAPAAADLADLQPTSPSRPPAPERLLVVDDNEENREIMSRKLRRHGYKILTADGGERALEMIAGEPFDLIVLDIMMPGMDGTEVLRRLRAQYSPAELPIIMATARSDTEDIVKCAELGANDHVAKPLDFDILAAKIRALLRLKAVAAASPPAPKEPTHSELAAGSVIAGRYRLIEKIGAGNFGDVYKARHLDLDLDMAVKVLSPRLSDASSLRRFRQEGVAACRVRHPNAVNVSDFGVTDSRVAYLVMELLEGVTLSQELKTQGCMSPSRVNEILQPICEVLSEAHAKDLVHRDIKPENVFLQRTPRGEVVKVLDFGIAKLIGEAAAQDSGTAVGWFLGTPAYIAPERLSGDDYDGRADVYSLGVMAFEMLAGRRPFRPSDKNPMSVIRQHLDDPPPSLRDVDPDLPAELESPIARSLKKDPAERPDAAAFARGFADCVAALEAGGGSWDRGDASKKYDEKEETPTSPTMAKAPKLGRWFKKLRS